MADRQTPRARRGGLFVLLGDGLLMLCALLGLLHSFLSLYGIQSSRTLIAVSSVPSGLLCCDAPALTGLTALFALLALAVWSLPRFRALVFGVLAAAWAALAFHAREPLFQGARLVCQAVVNLFADRVGWVDFMALSLELTPVEQLAAVDLFLAMLLALLALLLGWAVVRARRWWLVILLTLPPLLPGLLSDVYPSWPAFMALAACWCTMLLTSLCKWAAPSGRGRLTLAVLPAVAALLAGLTLALPMDGYARPQWTYRAEEALVSFGNRYLPFFSGLDGPFTNTITYVGSADAVDLAGAGPLTYTGRTVLKAASDYTGKVYLRGASLASYTGTSWEAMEDAVYQEYAGTLETGDAPSPLLFPAYSVTGGRKYSITVENTGTSGSCVYAPYQLAVQDWDEAGVLPVDDAYLARQRGQWTQTLSFLPDMPDIRYASSYFIYDSQVSRAEDAYRAYVQEHYLDVPEELRETLFQLMRAASFSDRLYASGAFSSEVACAEAVADLLDSLCEYDPNAPVTPEGEDFVEYFLTESHRGYCMHFASAATLMLRCLGVPARYVSGFTADLAAGKTVNVPDSAAHAWVEVYLDGYGWYPVEVTPSYTPDSTESDAPEASPSLSPSAAPSQVPADHETPPPSQTPSAAPSAVPQGPGAGSASGSGSGPFLGGLLAVLKWLAPAAALCALAWLGQYLPKRLRARRLSAPDVNRAVLDGYRCLTRLKKWGGAVDETALALAQKARFSQHTLTEEERQIMLALFDGERARLLGALSPVKRLAFRCLWGRPDQPPPKEEPRDDHP